MKMYYITLNSAEEAQAISYALLERQLAVCTNWFPITCAYRWQGMIKQEAEVVLIVKAQSSLREHIENVVSSHISYANFIAEIDVHSINDGFSNWLNTEVPKVE